MSDDSATKARRVARAYVVLIAITSIQIVLGALVRANHAGLACPDWPLCFGQLVPAFDVKVAFEWGHRLLAMVGVNFGFTGVSIWAYRSLRGSEAWNTVKPWIWLGAALLVTQNILGGLTVLQLLASWTVTLHLVFGNAFNAALAITAYSLSLGTLGRAGPAVNSTVRGLVTLALALLAAQVVLGGMVSSLYAGLACPDWPSCIEGHWFPGFEGALGVHLAHRWNAWLLVATLAGAAALGRSAPRLGRLCGLALVVGLAQAAVGIANVLLRLPVEVTGAHSGLAAALIILVALATFESWRTPATD